MVLANSCGENGSRGDGGVSRGGNSGIRSWVRGFIYLEMLLCGCISVARQVQRHHRCCLMVQSLAGTRITDRCYRQVTVFWNCSSGRVGSLGMRESQDGCRGLMPLRLTNIFPNRMTVTEQHLYQWNLPMVNPSVINMVLLWSPVCFPRDWAIYSLVKSLQTQASGGEMSNTKDR